MFNTEFMFLKRDGSMVYSQFLFHKLLVSCFFAGASCDITSFGLKSGSETMSGARVSLICTFDRYTGEIAIFKSDGKTNDGNVLSKCVQTTCRNLTPAYNFAITGNTIEITIKNLQRAADQKWWTCRTLISQTQISEKQFRLTVYTVPSSIRLTGPTKTCNLGQSGCEYTCTTYQCTYPVPTFTWLYVFGDGRKEVISHTTTVNEKSNSCADETKIYENTLTFSRYQLFIGNTPKTVRLQCYITFTGLSSGKRTSGVSQYIVFAVKVSTVQIYDGNNELTGNTLFVANKKEKLLNCVPGNGNPTPTVEWFIGSSPASTKAQFRFIPDNSHHGQQIYCVADNIPNNAVSDVVSSKPVLYVKVKIQFVYIEPAADTVISVIENIAEPAVCTTSAGRPGSTIKWYKNHIELGEGVSTDFERTDNNLNVTKSTRYINVLRSDSSWTLSCSASNFEGSSPTGSNNSKQLNILYPPEHLSIMFNRKPVTGPVMDVIKGTIGTLKCTADGNPPVSFFSWNINNVTGDTWIIDDNIQNGQIVNCTARNIMTSTAGLKVNGYGSISKTINIQYGAFIKRIEVNGNSSSTWVFKEKDPIRIACYVDSNPESTISLFQGEILLVEEQQSAVLIYNISSAQCSHTSQYICQAGNGITNVGQPSSKTVQISVECSPRLAFKIDPSVFAKENTTAVLSVTVLAFPVPKHYIWYRNISNRWEELANTPSILMTHRSLQFLLIIIYVTSEDYGEYKLTVDNTVGDPLNFTFILQPHDSFSSNCFSANAGDDASKLSTVAGATGTIITILVIIVVILVLFIWRNRIGFMCQNKDNLNYEMPNSATRGSEDRTYDIVNQGYSEYENSAP